MYILAKYIYLLNNYVGAHNLEETRQKILDKNKPKFLFLNISLHCEFFGYFKQT